MQSTIEKQVMMTKKLVLTAAVALSLSACGGGSGGSNDPSPTVTSQTITYQALPTFVDVNEGQQVRLSLNTKGSGASDLKFDWQVSFDNQPLTITGQGSDSISFTAPEVDGRRTVQVRVSLSEDSAANTFGFQDQFLTVNVADLTPSEPTITPDNELGSEVTEIDMTGVTAGSTWIETQNTYTKEAQLDNTHIAVNSQLTRSLIVESVDQNNQTIKTDYCGFKDVTSVDLTSVFASASCASDNRTRQFFQKEGSFSVVEKCDDTVIGQSTFKQKSAESITNFGNLTINFDNYPKLENSACGVVLSSEIESINQDNEVLATAEVTAFRLITEYEGNDFEVLFSFEGTTDDFLVSIGGIIGAQNKAIIQSGSYAELNGEDSRGMLTLDFGNTPLNFKGTFDLTIPRAMAVDEQLEGEFELVLE
ncbi:hypothetical protein [Pseudoalteromonas luteoviolacea]|uniref:PKD/Chitinase domain-containing protein n=1 Tax=Pseudoalteromonas luteoviolacea S4054 TaxID=1129367 RepID=A0A0F6AD02_9GAMM|nr:hypothetical protein [Pseudoalteromonas luteoviolacea]AOT09821.1 hypothetical protein S4054249_19200 [Pseudoalteromonas luteoviolacea]AOT14733.1 hypothetical protein S40542_19170 [Pseudoalteromonas luteoviolacea]AOT19648.1 hypothetical protein S4054_19175 [Pseudoalteromonas luteoviolacea]KKE84092.1 hypothetical protein N479_11825 [Pseudoalteromonas luteoviolacea S4054]KZN77486.1 hypothetical protein N481_05365 [Pseudoalteromonas luteoviolacea S4047-1]